MTQTSLKTQETKEVVQRYLDPTNDVSFKKVFATEGHKPSLISFLNAILRLQKEDWIKEVDFLPQEEAPLIDGGKKVSFKIEQSSVLLKSKRFPKEKWDVSILIVKFKARYERLPKWHTIMIKKHVFKLDGRRILKRRLVGKKFKCKMRYFEGYNLVN